MSDDNALGNSMLFFLYAQDTALCTYPVEDVDLILTRKMLKYWLQTAVNSHPTISCCQK